MNPRTLTVREQLAYSRLIRSIDQQARPHVALAFGGLLGQIMVVVRLSTLDFSARGPLEALCCTSIGL